MSLLDTGAPFTGATTVTTEPMEIQKASDSELPICPFCEEKIYAIKAKEFDKGLFKVKQKCVYFCPSCKKVLGVGQSAYM